MAKRKMLLKRKNGVKPLFAILLILLLLTLAIPAIGVGTSTSTLWIDIVNFFESIKVHFQSFWMFYTFGLALLFAVLGNSKK